MVCPSQAPTETLMTLVEACSSYDKGGAAWEGGQQSGRGLDTFCEGGVVFSMFSLVFVFSILN